MLRSDYLDLYGPLSDSDARFFFAQILAGVEHLHKNGICHMDLSLENVLVCEAPISDGRYTNDANAFVAPSEFVSALHSNKVLKVCDFGVAKHLSLASKNVRTPTGYRKHFAGLPGRKPGKLRYMAPEVLRGEDFEGTHSDVFNMVSQADASVRLWLVFMIFVCSLCIF